MPSEDIFIGRQPILDRQQRLVGYELLFRAGPQNTATVGDPVAATAHVLARAFIDVGAAAAFGPYKGFINCDAHLLLSDMLEALPAEKMVLEVLETVEVTPEIVERCADLKARGFTLALDDFVHVHDRFRPLLDVAEIVKVDLAALDEGGLVRTTHDLRQWPLQLLAEKVDTLAQAQRCRGLGFALFQGYYFARPALVAGKKLHHSELAVFRLLGLVFEEAGTAVLEAALKEEPALSMTLMRLTNSVATGAPGPITSLRQAIEVLGRRQLQRWLQVLLYTASSRHDRPSPLMQLAATRGRLMELLANRLHPGDREFEDHAFMVGILSLTPALMRTPLEDILRGMNPAAPVREALAGAAGELGAMLKLCAALEALAEADADALTPSLPGLDPATVNACQAQALAWANGIGRPAA